MADVACPNCAKSLQVAEETLGEEHTCEQCGTTFTLALQPEDSDAPGNVTMSMGQAFHVPPVAQEPARDSRTTWIVGGIVCIALIAGLLFLFLR